MDGFNLRLDDIRLDLTIAEPTGSQREAEGNRAAGGCREAADAESLPCPVARAVAIIGMDGRAGSAGNLEQFWELLAAGREGVRRLPEQRRKDVDAYLSARGIALPIQEELYLRSSYLQDIAGFDPAFFDLSKQEANYMDPNQRIFLETAWNALEDAGYGGSEIRGSDTGVYAGFSSDFGDDYRHMLGMLAPDSPEVAVSGNVKSIIASRIAYLLDLRGPAVLVDTACSSGLMAMYLACRAIQNGECEMAIAGAVKTQPLPILADGRSGAGIRSIKDTHSADGHTRTFDEACSGTVSAEGAFVYVLKALEDAQRDGDTIRAVILGGAANQDGASNGITSPNAEAQEDLILRALQDAGLAPEQLSYIEAHGTATRLGDPVEISGIQRALRHGGSRRQYCAVGSLKTNIGHLDNAAGLGAVAKVVLSMQKRTLPASLHFRLPNRNIAFVESPIYVNDRTAPWHPEEGERLYAGINSFGLSGTNCHLVLQSAPPVSERTAGAAPSSWLLPLSAKTPQALRRLCAAYRRYFADPAVSLADAVHTASRGRQHHRLRLAVRFDSREQLLQSLGRYYASGADALQEDAALSYGEHRLIDSERSRRRATDLTLEERERLDGEAAELLRASAGFPGGAALSRLAELYASGAELDWSRMLAGIAGRRIPLPTYPFERRRCWVEPAAPAQERQVQGRTLAVHPLLGEEPIRTLGHQLYRIALYPRSHWELDEHRLLGGSLLPGTAMLEMMVEWAQRELGEAWDGKLQQIMFYHPFTVADGAFGELHLLAEEEQDRTRLRFASLQADGQWQLHAEAVWKVAGVSPGGEAPRVDLAALRERLDVALPLEASDSTARPLQVGDRWLGSWRRGWRDESAQEYLVELELPERYHAEQLRYHLHPALLDIALNSVNHLMGDGEFYLPLSYGELQVHRKLPVRVTAHLRKTRGLPGDPTHCFDIKLYDADGQVALQVRNYTIKSATPSSSTAKPAAPGYAEVYRDYPLPQQGLRLPQGAVLIAGRMGRLGQELASELRRKGRRVLAVEPGAVGWEHALAAAVDEQLALAIFAWSSPDALAEGSTDWQAEAEDAVMQGFHFLQAWVKGKYRAEGGVILLAANGCDVSQEDALIQPGQAALVGLWRVAALEHEQHRLRCLEHDDQTSADALLAEMTDPTRPALVAYRASRAFVPQLEAAEIDVTGQEELPLPEDGVVLVAGGTGALGMEVAGWLARRGVKRLALLGTRPIPPRPSWETEMGEAEKAGDMERSEQLRRWLELERQVESLELCSLAIEDGEQTAAALQRLRSRYGRISGVFHLAGKAGDGFLLRKSAETFREVYAAKALGAIHLHAGTLEDRPDCFVMFSSIASLRPLPGQADYTAANRFADALARRRRQAGLPALSLQWTAWREIGMAQRMDALDEDGPFIPVQTEEALGLLEQALRSSRRETADALTVWMPGRLRRGWESRLYTLPASHRPSSDGSSAGHVQAHRTVLAGQERADEVLVAVADIWRRTLAVEHLDADEEFNSLGGNSLLTSHMLREYEKTYPGVMDIADLFTYTTVRQQADYVRVSIAGAAQASAARQEAAAGAEAAPGIESDMDAILDMLSRGEMTVEESSARLILERRTDPT